MPIIINNNLTCTLYCNTKGICAKHVNLIAHEIGKKHSEQQHGVMSMKNFFTVLEVL